jgi:hypothetical protein
MKYLVTIYKALLQGQVAPTLLQRLIRMFINMWCQILPKYEYSNENGVISCPFVDWIISYPYFFSITARYSTIVRTPECSLQFTNSII